MFYVICNLQNDTVHAQSYVLTVMLHGKAFYRKNSLHRCSYIVNVFAIASSLVKRANPLSLITVVKSDKSNLLPLLFLKSDKSKGAKE